MPYKVGQVNATIWTRGVVRTAGMPSGPEWFIVLAVVLLIFGGSQLPKLARNLGQAQKEFKHGLADDDDAPTDA